MNSKYTAEKIKSPTTLLALMVIVAEGLLFALTNKVNENYNLTLIIIGMISVIPLAIFILYKRPGLFIESKHLDMDQSEIYDAFISAPMASFKPEEYIQSREEILKIRETLKTECKFKKIFYAGTKIADANAFEASDLSIKEDYAALKHSKNFIFIYQHKLPSSALVEAGIAIALKKPSLYFTPNMTTLPFILRQAEHAFDFVKIYEVENSDKVINLIKTHGCTIFPKIE